MKHKHSTIALFLTNFMVFSALAMQETKRRADAEARMASADVKGQTSAMEEDWVPATPSTQAFIAREIAKLQIIDKGIEQIIASYHAVSKKATQALIQVISKKHCTEQGNKELRDVTVMKKLIIDTDLNMVEPGVPKDAYNALHWALGRYASYKIIKLFVRNGADGLLKNVDGETGAQFLNYSLNRMAEQIGDLDFARRSVPLNIAPHGWDILIWAAGAKDIYALFDGKISEAELEQEDIEAAQEEKKKAQAEAAEIKDEEQMPVQEPVAPQAVVLEVAAAGAEPKKDASCCSSCIVA